MDFFFFFLRPEMEESWTCQHRGKTYAHALTSAFPVCTCGSVARMNLVVSLAVCQIVVMNQQDERKNDHNYKKRYVDDSLLQY